MTSFIGVAIGLCLLYLLMSILCSYLKEAIAAAFGLRAQFLQLGLQRMLAAGASALKDKNGTAFDLVEAILAHPLIQSLSQSAEKKPTYIPDHIFVSAMEAVLAEKLGGEAKFGEILSKLPKDSAIAKSLSAVIRDIEEDPNQCRAAVSTWFNEAMDRVGGWYKREAQVILFAAGVMAAVVLNADSINVATKLWTDSSLRDQVSLVASNVLRSTPPPPVTPAVPAAVAAGESAAPVSTVQPDSSTLEKQLNYVLAGLQKTSGQLYKLPIGWDSEARLHWSIASWRREWTEWLIAVCGWVLTGLAASLGAPFWFDLLGKAINMRMAGVAPQPSATATAATTANPVRQNPLAQRTISAIGTNPAEAALEASLTAVSVAP